MENSTSKRAEKHGAPTGLQTIMRSKAAAWSRRLLNPFKHLSGAFKNADLHVLAVDPAGFKAAEDAIYQSAEDEGRNPKSVPPGILREHSETKNGHTYTKFFGRPITWMAPMIVQGKRIKRIIERSDNGGPGRTL